MTDFMGVIRDAIASGRAAREGMGDYLAPDGLMHCGRCHEPVEIVSDVFPGVDRLPVPCRCQNGNRLESSWNQSGPDLEPIDEVVEPVPFDETDEECVERLIQEARKAREKHK